MTITTDYTHWRHEYSSWMSPVCTMTGKHCRYAMYLSHLAHHPTKHFLLVAFLIRINSRYLSNQYFATSELGSCRWSAGSCLSEASSWCLVGHFGISWATVLVFHFWQPSRQIECLAYDECRLFYVFHEWMKHQIKCLHGANEARFPWMPRLFIVRTEWEEKTHDIRDGLL